MIWFDVKKLEAQLVRNEVSERSSFKYLIFYLIVVALMTTIPEDEEYSHVGWEISDLLSDLLITITGTYLAFLINSKGDDRLFLKRYLSLSFVHGLRLVVVLMILHLAYKIIMFVIPLELWHFFNDLFTGDLPELLFSLVVSLIFYLLLLRSFKRVNSIGNEKGAPI